MTPGTVSYITYYNENKDETTERVIIPMYVPPDTVSSLDVTTMSLEDRAKLSQQILEYQEYKQAALNAIFSFDNWLDHTAKERLPLKWRSFKVDNITEL